MQKRYAIIIVSAICAIAFFMVGILFGLLFGSPTSQTPNRVSKTTPAISESEEEVGTRHGVSIEENTVEEMVDEAPATPDTLSFTPYKEWNKTHNYMLASSELGSSLESQLYYSIGTVSGNGFEDNEMILAEIRITEMGTGTFVYRFVEKEGRLILLTKYSDDPTRLRTDDMFTKDDTLQIASFDFPEELSGPKPRQKLKFAGNGFSFFNQGTYLFKPEGLKKVFTHETFGHAYTTNLESTEQSIYLPNAFYFRAPDGTVRVYIHEYDFFNTQTQTPQITWNNGVKNEDAYSYQLSEGCGIRSYAEIIRPSDVDRTKDLVKVGTSSKGDAIYELKDSNHSILRQIYDERYVVFQEEQEKMPYEEFIKMHPTIFWVDPFDRLVRAENNAFIPQAECGKPVIYLYPEKETKVSVQVHPGRGITVSDPEYGNGWNVIAKPSGELFDLGTKKVYPYLFWEGKSDQPYQTPEQGFVVARGNVQNFLEEKLTLLGLNQKERADFIEFWLGRMQSAPYYFVTFMGNHAMDALAPLSISPKPDTIIRVFMDFLPLSKPIKAQSQILRAPERKGFTVVEWGGTLR